MENNRTKIISLLNTIKNLTSVPFEYGYYTGNAKTYIVWLQTDMGNSMSADDGLQICAEYFDVSIYSNKDYESLLETVVSKFTEDEEVTFQPSRCSEDLFDEDTKMFHKTLCFAVYKKLN